MVSASPERLKSGQKVWFNRLGRFILPNRTHLSKRCRHLPRDWNQDNKKSDWIDSGDSFSLIRPNCQNGVGISRVWNQDKKSDSIDSGDSFPLIKPNCQNDVSISRDIEISTKTWILWTQKMHPHYLDLIVKMVWVHPKWFISLFQHFEISLPK